MPRRLGTPWSKWRQRQRTLSAAAIGRLRDDDRERRTAAAADGRTGDCATSTQCTALASAASGLPSTGGAGKATAGGK